MSYDKVYTKPVEEFTQKFFPPIDYKKQNKVPSYKYQGSRGYASEDRQTLLENVELEKKFGDKYGDKNLWTRYAYINSDEALKDMLNENENKVDPYTLAGMVSAEGMVDELHDVAGQPDWGGLGHWKPESNEPDPILDSIAGMIWFGTDTFAGRYDEFKKKGLTSLEPYKGKYDPSKADKYFINSPKITNEKEEEVLPADFFTPRAGINAVSTYIKNIENIIGESKVKVTPQEKEQLTYIGYNYGENGLKSYLKKGKTGQEILNMIKKERPFVFSNSVKRMAVSKELRENKSLERIQNE